MVAQVSENRVGDAAKKLGADAQEFGRAVADTAQNTIGEYSDQGRSLIREHPYKSVLVALAAGALLGAFIFRR